MAAHRRRGLSGDRYGGVWHGGAGVLPEWRKCMRFCDLRQKEVINVRDCQRLGCVADIEFDPNCGKICQLIIPGPGKFCGLFGRESECIIGWNCVRQIGPDIILVDVNVEAARRLC